MDYTYRHTDIVSKHKKHVATFWNVFGFILLLVAHHYKWEGYLAEGLLDHGVIPRVGEEQKAERV